MRAVLDPNILIVALLSPSGAPPRSSRAGTPASSSSSSRQRCSPNWSGLACPELRTRVTASEAGEFVSLLRSGAILARDPPTPGHHSADPGDDYSLALADLLPIQTARAFLDALEVGSAAP